MGKTIWDLNRQPRIPVPLAFPLPRRFSLRLLLVLVTLFALGFAYIAKPLAEYQRQAVVASRFEEQGATVQWTTHATGFIASTLKSWGLETPYKRVYRVEFSNAPLKAISLDGVEALHELEEFSAPDCGLVDDELIKLVEGKSRLRSLQVKGNARVTDASYEALLERYPNLQIALPFGTSVSNAALRRYCASPPVLGRQSGLLRSIAHGK